MSIAHPVPRSSAEGQRLIARALRLEEAADAAFARWYSGERISSSGAARLRSEAEEAWADVRLGIIDGELIETELSR